MRDKIFAVIIFLITILLFIFMPQIRDSLGQRPMFSQEFAVGVVQDVLEEDLTEDPIVSGRYRGIQKISVKILDGSKKNNVYETYNTLSALHNTRAYKDLKAVFTIRVQDGKESIWLYNQKRDTHIYILVLLFALSLIFLGKRQGFKSLLGLVFTCTVIVSLLVPALFAGFAPIPISILLVSVVTFVSFILVSGFSRKTYAAILGTICGISIAGLISIIVSYTA
ncbi:YibE/F family protein, partial [Treponema denticola]